MAEIKTVNKYMAISSKRGNGTLRYEVWTISGVVSRYNLAYINHKISSKDNGRVLGYDNQHGGHHRHYLGTVEPVDTTDYDEIERRFVTDWMEILEAHNEKRGR